MTSLVRGSCDAHELASLVRAGDAQALDRLTRCLSDRLHAVGARACRDRDRGRDAVQDALLAAGENLHAYRGEGSVEGWLSGMVVHACAKMRRGRKNDPALHVLDAPLVALGPPADACAERAERVALLERALGGLSPTDRTLVLLADLEEWDSPRIAAHLGMTAGAVRTRLSRIRARLRASLDPSDR